MRGRLFVFGIVTALLCASIVSAGPAGAAAPGTVSAKKISLVAFEMRPAALDENPLPECIEIHVWSPCGSVDVGLTLSGFNAFGGISSCSEASDECVDDPAGSSRSLGGIKTGENGGTAHLILRYRCENSNRIRIYRATLDARIEFQGVPSYVGAYTRIDSNSAKIWAAFIFPATGVYSSCAEGATHLESAWLNHFVIRFQGAGGVPDQTFAHRGGFQFPIPA